jgi:hypothetical protein
VCVSHQEITNKKSWGDKAKLANKNKNIDTRFS